ncbi:MAG: hypothetical protein KF729_20740 [Sandaracinaceae bacterium]|nr:hypothetical protein [Sandaracinaceae bacterium]
MLKRLGLGLLKGLVIGGAIGAALQYGLQWTNAAGLLGFLVSMGAAGTAGVFAGKAPWKEGAWIEAALKGMVGVGLGALAYWGLSYIPFGVPFPGLEGTHAIAALPVVFAPAIAGVYGSLVELDNTGDEGDAKGKEKKGPKARVDASDDDDEAEVSAGKRGARARKKA